MVILVIAYNKYSQFIPTSAEALTQDQTYSLNAVDIQNIRQNSPITDIHVYKAKRLVQLRHDTQIIRSYSMRLGFDPIGHKVQEGDGKTPEGHYVIDWRNPNSQFYKSLHISYPNAEDKKKAQDLGVSPGGDIMIHGSANHQQLKALPQLMDYLPQKDWTWGCVAVRNTDMDEIWQLVDNGTPIMIYP
nr:L,D-transpeptidase family protein [Acinetobacter lanii]